MSSFPYLTPPPDTTSLGVWWSEEANRHLEVFIEFQRHNLLYGNMSPAIEVERQVKLIFPFWVVHTIFKQNKYWVQCNPKGREILFAGFGAYDADLTMHRDYDRWMDQREGRFTEQASEALNWSTHVEAHTALRDLGSTPPYCRSVTRILVGRRMNFTVVEFREKVPWYLKESR